MKLPPSKLAKGLTCVWKKSCKTPNANAGGHLPALASNMVTAFAATVIGLTISVTAYLIAAARESWVRADSQVLAFHAERVLRTAKGKE